MLKKIRVLIVDDSSYMRYLVGSVLISDPSLEVAGAANDGLAALEAIRMERPDVVILDIEMPRLDGIGFLERLHSEDLLLPVVIFSRVAEEGAEITLHALELGALDFVTKPTGADALTLRHLRKELIAKIHAAARLTPERLRELQKERTGGKKMVAAVEQSGVEIKKVVVIAASMGGPPTLEEVIPLFPAELPACILIIQHMPKGFTRSLAERLDGFSKLEVREAAEGDAVKPATVYIAPGDYHMRVSPGGSFLFTQEPAINGVRPSADVTMASVADVYGARSIAVVLSGMGFDGTRGGYLIRKAGGLAIAEDTATCIIDGMPSSLIKSGNADRILPAGEIAHEITSLLMEQ